MSEVINPNSDRQYINQVDITKKHYFPLFFHKIKLERFRHIENLSVEFKNPVSVISGSNKSGKTTLLLSIACSHYNFKRRNVVNGNMERTRWGDIIRFTIFDRQNQDWTYFVDYREGTKFIQNKRGQRKYLTNKWNGVAKKESQIGTTTPNKPNGGRSVILIDLERILPSRGLSLTYFNKVKHSNTSSTPFSQIKNDYLSYILEQEYVVESILKTADKEFLGYSSNNYKYSSYNTASGEDVLSRIISDIVDAEDNSLILIEEIEIGLHPKIQRRLINIIYHESKRTKKQFIITTHSQTVLSAVDTVSRIFIENNNNTVKTIPNISVSAALSKMDSLSYPLINLFIEDNVSLKIVNKAIESIQNENNLIGFKNLVNPIITGAANETYEIFKAHKNTYSKKKVDCGYACILDGDKREEKKSNRDLAFPAEELLFFHFSNESPEKFLLREYLNIKPHSSLEYHLNSNPHCLFSKMVEFNLALDDDDAFEKCWDCFISSSEGKGFMSGLCTFLINSCKKFSAEL